MKTLKTAACVSILTIGMTSSVFASWWNPTTWKIFSKESAYLSCNGSKYSTCPNGQTFVCPVGGEDAFCQKNREAEVRTPKTVDVTTITSTTSVSGSHKSSFRPYIPSKRVVETPKVDTSVAIEKCKSKYQNHETRQPDNEADVNLWIYQTNNVIDQMKAGNLVMQDSKTILNTIEDGYFKNKYEQCLNDIK